MWYLARLQQDGKEMMSVPDHRLRWTWDKPGKFSVEWLRSRRYAF
jgi:hypothetical protein